MVSEQQHRKMMEKGREIGYYVTNAMREFGVPQMMKHCVVKFLDSGGDIDECYAGVMNAFWSSSKGKYIRDMFKHEYEMR